VDRAWKRSTWNRVAGWSARSYAHVNPTLPKLAAALAGELIGTWLMVLVGTGAVATAVLTGALNDL
jgi:hypothetical protein